MKLPDTPSRAAAEAAMEYLAGYCFVGNARRALSAAAQADPALGFTVEEMNAANDWIIGTLWAGGGDHSSLEQGRLLDKFRAKLQRSLEARKS